MVAGTGLLVAAFAGSVPVAAAGFALAGLGIANMVPIAFSAAGTCPGSRPGRHLGGELHGLFLGLLFAPSLIGFIARHTGLGPIDVGLPLLYVVVLALSGLARYADPEAGR